MQRVTEYLDRRNGVVVAMLAASGHEVVRKRNHEAVEEPDRLYRGFLRGETPEGVLVDYILEHGEPCSLDPEAEMVRRTWTDEVLPTDHPWRAARARSLLLLPWVAKQVEQEWRAMVVFCERVQRETDRMPLVERRLRFRAAMRTPQAAHLHRIASDCEMCGHPLAEPVRSLANQIQAAVSSDRPFGPGIQITQQDVRWRISGIPTINGIEKYHHRAEAILAALAGAVAHGASCHGPLFVVDRGVV